MSSRNVLFLAADPPVFPEPIPVKNVKTVLRFTVTGIVCGLVIGWLLSLVSGNYYVTWAVGLLGMLIGGILGIVHRSGP